MKGIEVWRKSSKSVLPMILVRSQIKNMLGGEIGKIT